MRDAPGFSIEDAGLPEIEVRAGELHTLATRAEQAIIAAGLPIYQRGIRLVRPATQQVPVSRGRTTTAACFIELNGPAMLDALARAATWTKYDGRAKELRAANPPREVADVLLSRFGEWTVPPVSGVITTPTLRPDHTILCEPGYDPATRLFLAIDPTLKLPTIPCRPTLADATAALATLDGLLAGFPFTTPTDRAVALSALLTPVCRGAMSVAPLHAFRASTAGTGKSYLADVASAIATARPCPVASVSSKDGETESRLVGLLLAGFPILSLDNVNGELGSDLLCQAVERPLVQVRKLGGSDIYEIETRATIFATGNALRVRGDMTRRTLVCDLDAQMERPELRTFAFDPVETVLADRGRFVAAALTVVRAFVLSGATPTMQPLASYRDYDATVRGALVWLGQPDPAQSMERAREDDPELGELRDMMEQWHGAIGTNTPTTAKAVVQVAEQRRQDEDTGRPLPDYANAGLRDAVLAVAGTRGTIDNNKLGKWLRGKKGRIVLLRVRSDAARSFRFETVGVTDGAARWALKEVRAQGGQVG